MDKKNAEKDVSTGCAGLKPDSRATTEDTLCHNLASTTEITGMIPTPPLTDAEVEGYESLFYRPQQEADNARKSDSPEEQKNKEKRP